MSRALFNYRTRKELLKTAEFYSRPQQQWRLEARLPLDLRSNAKLLRELYRIGNRDPKRVHQLLIYCEKYVRQTAPLIQQQAGNFDPTHPAVMNNINHPLNPSNPRNLQLNPSMNLLFVQSLNEEAADEEQEEDEKVDEQHDENLLQAVLNEEILRIGMQQLSLNPVDPYKELNLSPTAKKPEIEARCLEALATHAPAYNEPPSEKFGKTASAALLLNREMAGHKTFFGKENRHHSLEITPRSST